MFPCHPSYIKYSFKRNKVLVNNFTIFNKNNFGILLNIAKLYYITPIGKKCDKRTYNFIFMLNLFLKFSGIIIFLHLE